MIPSTDLTARGPRQALCRALCRTLCLATCVLATPTAGADARMLLPGSADVLDGWTARAFEGETDYAAARSEAPVVDCGPYVVRARADASASGRFLEFDEPVAPDALLSWSWTVAAPVDVPDETRREGDDFAARVYVMFSGGFAFWRTTSLVYVWGDDDAPAEPWPNPYTEQAVMMTVRRGDGGRWHRETRDLAADYRRAFGRAPPEIVAVAIMSDTDQSGASAEAAYACMTLTPTS